MHGNAAVADLEHWLITESQYVRVYALATGRSIEEVFGIVGEVLRKEVRDRFPGVDAIELLRWEVGRSLDLRSICYSEVEKMRALIQRVGEVMPDDPPPTPAAPAVALSRSWEAETLAELGGRA